DAQAAGAAFMPCLHMQAFSNSYAYWTAMLANKASAYACFGLLASMACLFSRAECFYLFSMLIAERILLFSSLAKLA
ncbi:MAG: hypothetical protein QXN16_03675, partial [Candidatus Micrarchaeaceae archaeon]